MFLYKPELVVKLSNALKKEPGFENAPLYEFCCRKAPTTLPPQTCVLNVCSGCDRRYRSLYEGISTKSFWEIIAESDVFPFPNYGGAEISIHDACPTRNQDRVTTAVRTLLDKMNLKLVEPANTREKASCCGDSLHKHATTAKVIKRMKKRAAEMPCDDVVVYCVSCIKSIYNGGKKSRFMVDLLFNEETIAGETDPDIWHEQLNRFIEAH